MSGNELAACLVLDSLAKSHPSLAAEIAGMFDPRDLLEALRHPSAQMATAAAAELCSMLQVEEYIPHYGHVLLQAGF